MKEKRQLGRRQLGPEQLPASLTRCCSSLSSPAGRDTLGTRCLADFRLAPLVGMGTEAA